jgi:spore coat protein A, manganese oxidase
MELSRRDLLKIGLFSSAALMLPAERIARTQLALKNRIPESRLPTPFTVPFQTPPVLVPDYQTSQTAYYTLQQRQVQAEVLPGLRTTIWGYNGITPGPTIMNRRGQAAVVRQVNDLPNVHPDLRYNVWTSTHLHGSCSLPQYDGYASDITNPGQFKDYHYPNVQDARTLWYHDHGVHITAPNAYMGLAAQYILHDDLELSLPIPHGKYDVPMILKDAMFQTNGDLIYDDNSQSGVYGDVILVNGKPWPLMQVEPRKYRFRFLNASVSRSYHLALDTGDAMTVIGTDGGLMTHPQEVGDVLIGMAERYEIVIDFSKYRPGQRVVLRNLQPANNIDHLNTHLICAFEVGDTVTDWSNNEVPQDLNPNMNVMGLKESDAVRTRNFRFERGNGHWTINGTTWEDVVNSDYELVVANPGFEDIEIWELHNPGGGWFHPIHIHLVDFKVLDRNGQPPRPYEKGPKDVVYVGEGELVRVIMKFEHQRGKYMMHCHNLVHEDHDMMTQFMVGDPGPEDPNDPIKADPCKDLPGGPLFEREEERGNSGKGGGGSGSSNGGSGGSSSEAQAAPAAPAAAPGVNVKGIKVRGKANKKKIKRAIKRRKTTAKAKPKAKVVRKPVAKPKPKPKRRPLAKAKRR